MKDLSRYNPAVLMTYFFSVAGVVMFSQNPIITILSLLGAVAYYGINNRNSRDSHGFYLIMLLIFLTAALINPFVNHRGVTPLFMLNDSAITLEALLYGVFTGLMISAVLCWFKILSQLMTADKIQYLLGKTLPKTALIFTMALRFIPLISAQIRKTNKTQRALGLYRDSTLSGRIKGGCLVFSSVSSWSLENGIITADSMSARGYGTGRRSRYSLYRFYKSDVMLLLIILLLFGISLVVMLSGGTDFNFYPAICDIPHHGTAIAAYISYGALCLLPVTIQITEGIRWKYLMSKI